jgi:hypothetical protein
MTQLPEGAENEGRWEDEVPEGLNDELAEPLRRNLERDPATAGGPPLEDTAQYERSVEDDTPLPPSELPAVDLPEVGATEDDPATPVFREPQQ